MLTGKDAEVMFEKDWYALKGDNKDTSMTDQEKADEGSGLQKRRKKSPGVFLTDEQENM